ncbi:MAG: FAD-dependent oxidoreductase [Gemmatimonadota bacterium]|nr:MAG: FAD-dependent oxidoreductase [Gemmatimonadota bacterium]
MKRDNMVERLRGRSQAWDMVVIGGGATGMGIAVDAASRRFDVLLLEQSDFGKGTSSRSTKLVHGGVRYLQQGNISLVMEALKERGLLLQNAPHLVSDLAFVVPNYEWWEAPFYGVGMKVYDVMAGRYRFGRSRNLSVEETIERLPNIERTGLRGGVLYHDGQFDDARLLVNLAQTAFEQGATILNYAKVVDLLKDREGFLAGVALVDQETGEEYEVSGRVVINATGPFTDGVRRMDNAAAQPLIQPSQGVHITLDRSFLVGDTAIMVPRTADGRVMFALPWHDHVIVGTTDTPLDEIAIEPRPRSDEIDFILETAEPYLAYDPTREDILSAFAGIRPLVRAENAENTAVLSREHSIEISGSGLMTIAGGKWTTYRNMAQDCVDYAITVGDLPDRPCVTKSLQLHGHMRDAERFGDLASYGSDAAEVRALIESEDRFAERLHTALPYRAGEVVWSARFEMARAVDDYLSRRSRATFLNAQAALEMAPRVARLMAEELKRDDAWVQEQLAQYTEIASGYLP